MTQFHVWRGLVDDLEATTRAAGERRTRGGVDSTTTTDTRTPPYSTPLTLGVLSSVLVFNASRGHFWVVLVLVLQKLSWLRHWRCL